MLKDCHNCLDEMEQAGMDNGYYRDYEGCKTDASLFPICRACVDAGEYRMEKVNGNENYQRLYLGPSRSYALKSEQKEWENKMNGYGR